jgi:squalene-associated FAD-dependent desaturase
VTQEQRKPVAVVGGGYAGMAAAVELAERGVPVTVYEAARELGGRARCVQRHGTTLDNGQHILIGAYAHTLALMQRVGVPAGSLRRLPLQWRFPPHFELKAVPAPAPWHLALGLLKSRGLTMRARLACARFLQWGKRRGFRLDRDRSVAALLREHGQDPAAIRFLWEPLCVAALNTPIENASARVFLNVIRDGLTSTRSASELLLPTIDLSALFPRPAARFVEARGGSIRTGCTVNGIEREGAGFAITSAADRGRYAAVILATASRHAAALAAPFGELDDAVRKISALAHQPIVTVYLQYRRSPRLPFPMLGMSGRYGQWLFDRARLCGQAGLLAVVISARGREERLDRETLAEHVQAEVAAMLPDAGAPAWTQVIEEKRATFACVPEVDRPAQRTELPGLYLAGDYTASDYPATLEAAVRSGQLCAQLACEHLAR